MKHAVTRSRKRKKIKVVEAFGGCCTVCGYNKSINALQFHHTDPSLKKWSPTKLINERALNFAIKTLEKEKCVLVCANCHAETHDDEYDIDLMTKISQVVKSKCLVCDGEYWARDIDKRKYCSPTCAGIACRKVKDRPSKEQLEEALKKFTYVRVGKMYGVSDNAVRKWAKKYGIIPR